MKMAVWLVNGWATKAHSIDGKTTSDVWATRCGQKIQARVGDKITENGIVISWELLNQSRMELCRKCFPASVEGVTRLLGEIAALQAKIDEARKVLSTPEGSSTIEYELGKIQRAKVILTSPSTPPPADNFAHVGDALELRITSQNEVLSVVDNTGATWTKVTDIDRATLDGLREKHRNLMGECAECYYMANLTRQNARENPEYTACSYPCDVIKALDLIAQGGEPAEITHTLICSECFGDRLECRNCDYETEIHGNCGRLLKPEGA